MTPIAYPSYRKRIQRIVLSKLGELIVVAFILNFVLERFDTTIEFYFFNLFLFLAWTIKFRELVNRERYKLKFYRHVSFGEIEIEILDRDIVVSIRAFLEDFEFELAKVGPNIPRRYRLSIQNLLMRISIYEDRYMPKDKLISIYETLLSYKLKFTAPPAADNSDR